MIRSFLLSFGLVITLLSAAAQQPSPSVRIPDTQDWGTIRLPKDQFVEAELPIENIAAKGVVKILEIKPGCGCTKTDPDKWELNPGEKATVKIKLNLTPSQSGPISKSVVIRTLHGSDTTVKVVMLTVNLERVLMIGPSTFVAFNDVAVGAKGTSTLTFSNPSNVPVTITKLVLENGLTADITDGTVLKPNESRKVVVSITPQKAGQIYGAMRFSVTGNGDPEEFIVTAHGTTK